MGAAGGFGYLDSIRQNWKYSDGDMLQFGMKLAGPIGSDVADTFDTGERIVKSIQEGDKDQVLKDAGYFAAKRLPIPVFSGAIKQAVKPYSASSNNYYDVTERLGSLGRVDPEDRKSWINAVMEGKDVSETIVAARIVGKIYDKETGDLKEYTTEKERVKVRKEIEKYGIDIYKALNYAKNRSSELRDLGTSLNSEEKAIRDMGQLEREQYFDENGVDYDDFPALKAYLESRGEWLN
jgi:ribosomal protein S18